MKNVIFVSPHSDLYGAERSMITVMLSVRKAGYNPILLIKKEGPIETSLIEHGIEYHIVHFRQCINVNGKHDYLRGIKDYIRDWQTLKQFVREYKSICKETVLVHTNSIITFFGIMLATKLGVPHVQHIREFGREDFDMEFNFGKSIVARIINKSTKIVCISDAVYNTYADILDNTKMVRIYNGIDISKKQHKSQTVKSNVVKMVIVGRLSKEKGQMQAIKASKILIKKGITNFRIHLYGNGTDEEMLNEYVQKNDLNEYIVFEGYQSEIDYSQYDIALMTSKSEAFGRVTVEYMLSGLPVIGIASGGTLEIVVDNITGLLSDWDDINRLALNMERLIKDIDLRVQLGQQGKIRATKLFTEKAYGQNIIALYKEILEQE